jgi:hypothetical protein
VTKRTRMSSHVWLSKMSGRRFRIAPTAYIVIYASECKVTKRLATAYKPQNASINSTWKYANTHKLYNHIVINGRNVVKFSACCLFWLCRYCRDSYTRAHFWCVSSRQLQLADECHRLPVSLQRVQTGYRRVDRRTDIHTSSPWQRRPRWHRACIGCN